MSAVEIDELLESDLAGYNLVVQVTQQDECLLVMLNRPADSDLDYPALTETITARIRMLELAGIHNLLLCSRVLGEYDADWQAELSLLAPPQELIPDAIDREDTSSEPPLDIISIQLETDAGSTSEPPLQSAATPPIPEANSEVAVVSTDVTAIPPSKFSHYCFTRNKTLVTRKILPPDPKLAEIVQFFHALPDCSQEAVLPILDRFFHSPEPVSTEQLDSEIQQWFEQLQQLKESEVRTAAIWFSRYCFNPEKTMAEVMEVIEFEAVKAAAAQAAAKETAIAAPSQNPTTISRTETTPKSAPKPSRNSTPTSRLPAKATTWQSLILPIGWVIFSLIAIVLAVRSVNPTELVATACQNATGKQEYCRLAVQLVGELTFHEISQNTVPVSEENRSSSIETCAIHGNIRAGMPFEQAFKTKPPVLSSSGEEVLPGIFIVDVKQKSLKEPEVTVRTACVFANTKSEPATETAAQAEMALLAVDTIPINWPDESYKRKPLQHETLKKTLGIYNVAISLGAGTVFTAVGILIAAMLELGIRVDTLASLYQAAFIFGVLEATISTVPIGWLGGLAFNSLILGLVSVFVKGFHVQWTEGYKIVGCGALVIILTRFILNLALLSSIAALV